MNLYIKLIKDIMFNCKWIVDDINMIPNTFRKLFINQLEVRFYNLMNDIKNMKYDDTEHELKIIHNKTKRGLILLISELYNNKIIGNQLIRYIFKNLENAYEETKLEQYLEYWLIFFSVVIEKWKDNEKQYLNEQLEFINSKKSTLSNKLQFMILDQYDILNKFNYKFMEINTINNNINNADTINISEINTQIIDDETDDYELIILSATEYTSYDLWLDNINIKNVNQDKLLLDLLQITLSDKNQLDLVKNVLEFLLEKKYFSKEEVTNKIQLIRDDIDFSDNRYYEKHLSELSLI